MTQATWTRVARPTADGWYNASADNDPTCMRWWFNDRQLWSAPVFVGDPPQYWQGAKSEPGESQGDEIAWRDVPPGVALSGAYFAKNVEPAPGVPVMLQPDERAELKPSNPKDAIGVKKAKFSVIPAGVLFDVGLAMLEGACKYGRHNYRGAGVRASVYYDAAMGHLADWWEGQNLDPDSNLSHVTKAIASLVVLRDAMFQGMLTDDRPPRSKVSKIDFNGTAAEIIDRHADKAPKHYTLQDTV